MKFIISLFWSFIFAFISIFIVSSLLGNNGISSGISLLNCTVLAITFVIGAALLDYVVDSKEKK